MGTNLTAAEVSKKERLKSDKNALTPLVLITKLIDNDLIKALSLNALVSFFSIIGLDTIDLDFYLRIASSAVGATRWVISAPEALRRLLYSRQAKRVKAFYRLIKLKYLRKFQ